MPTDKLSLKREELYELVWSTPMLKLAKTYKISDRGLAKMCKRLEIPVPGLGYWAKVDAGKPVERIPLPPATTATIPLAEVNQPTEPGSEIEVISLPGVVHPLVEQSLLALSSPTAELWEGYMVNHSSPHLNLKVSRAQLGRALQIMNTLLTTLESRGHSVSIQKTGAGYLTWVSVDQEKVAIALDESMGGTWGSDHRRSAYVPTGVLSLNIDYRGGMRRSWKDLKKGALETFIGDFIASITHIQDEKRKNREDREAYEQRAAKKAQEEEQKRRQLKQQKSFLKKIETQVEYWERAEGIRAYLDAVRSAIEAGDVEVTDKNQIEAWLDAGRGIADQLDPITGGWHDNPPEFAEQEESRNSYMPSKSPPPTNHPPYWVMKHRFRSGR